MTSFAKNTKRLPFTTAAFAITVLALSGCGGPKHVYDFTQIKGMEPADEIGVEIPNSLKEAAGTDAERLLVTSFTAKAHELEGSRYCAIDLDITYADGAIAKLTEPRYTQEQATQEAQRDFQSYLDRWNAATVRELEQNIVSKIKEHAEIMIEGNWFGPQTVDEHLMERYGTTDLKVASGHYLGGSSRNSLPDPYPFDTNEAKATVSVEKVAQKVKEHYEERYQEKVETAEAVPLWERVSHHLYLDKGQRQSDFSESAPEEGSYFSDDYKKVTIVQDCAKAPYDPSSSGNFSFPIVDDENGVTSFATVTCP